MQDMPPQVPSCSVKREDKGGTWKKLLDAGGSPHRGSRNTFQGGGSAKRSPWSPQAGGEALARVQGVLSPMVDDDSTEAKILRLEKKLKRNLPSTTRAELEVELEVLKEFQKVMMAGTTPPSSSASNATIRPGGGARRKVGVQAPLGEEDVLNDWDEEEEEEEVVVVKKVNLAAPKMTHPQTMARMQDWKGELDRRIKEQKELDASKGISQEKQPSPLFGLPFLGGELGGKQAYRDSPMGKIQEAVEGLVGGVADVLGLGNAPKHESIPEPSVLPPQTFSRRL